MSDEVKGKGSKQSRLAKRQESDLGRRLRELSDKALASGIETLSLKEIHKLIAETRGRPS